MSDFGLNNPSNFEWNDKMPANDSKVKEDCSDEEYFRPIQRLRMMDAKVVAHRPKPCTSFLIEDILGPARGIVRPWDMGPPVSEQEDLETVSEDSNCLEDSPLDALRQMTSKAFEDLETDDLATDTVRDPLNLFNNRPPAKKKRKSRTAFTNHQIFELEKRFLYQKYLSPADRDEMAQSLGLSNAQVITWFQNRRAKLKRDMEELKKDMTAAKERSSPD